MRREGPVSLGEERRSLVRVGIYLVALVVVVILIHQRHILIPSHGLRVIQVREVHRLGSLVAREGHKLIVVEVRLIAPGGLPDRLKPEHFVLVDSQGREHRPDPLSPLLLRSVPPDRDEEIEGTLVFRLPREAVGESLYFHAEIEEDA